MAKCRRRKEGGGCIKSGKPEARRTRSTLNRSNRSRTTAFQRISARLSTAVRHTPSQHPAARSRAITAILSRIIILITSTHPPRELFSADRTGRHTFPARNWSTSLSRIRLSRAHSMAAVKSNVACVRHTRLHAAALLLELHYDRRSLAFAV